jgi:hypothetical protein
LHPIIWRVVPRAAPTWATRCTECCAPALECTGRFRVNSNGSIHDVWLIYECPSCGHRRKRSVHRRVRETVGLSLDPYRENDSRAAALWAFALSRGESVPYQVERPAIIGPALLAIQIDQPFPCGARWDMFLAHEIGASRRQIRATWRSSTLFVPSASRPRSVVRDRDQLFLRLNQAGHLVSSLKCNTH